MTRAILRYVRHSIRHVPEGGWVFEAACVASNCAEDSGPQDTQDAAQDWCLRHTGRNPTHDLFRRAVTDHARVTREE
ncbi:hypothetical protein ACF07B_03315 [Streptomyces sp. NPDC015532]|uniref:DUF7848 domain-containing protein n=1 Tax=Streptomyces sp. NPDC015532 TaxID=3364960 RepID=UPI0036F5BCDD